jgi:nitrogen regulatory protein P-II 1
MPSRQRERAGLLFCGPLEGAINPGGGSHMKKIEATIRPARLEDLKAALDNIQIRGMTVSEVKGRGLQNNQKQYYRGREVCLDLNPKIKVEIVCNDESVENIISTIINLVIFVRYF